MRVLYVITAVFGSFAVATRFMDVLTSVTFLALLLVALALFGAYLAQVKVYHGTPVAEGGIRSLPARGVALAQRFPLGEVALDAVLIVVSYLGAYLLKFESNIYGPFLVQFGRSVPYVIAIKLAVFLVTGVYKNGWRYAGFPEVVSLAKASSLASAAVVIAVAVLWRFDDYSRSVFVIDWILFTWLIVIARMSFRLLGHWVQSVSGAGDRSLLVVGTRERGAAAVRAIQGGLFGDFVPAGFVDVDSARSRHRVAGIEVLGALSELGAILDAHTFDGVVVIVGGRENLWLEALSECTTRRILCYRISPLEVGEGEAGHDYPTLEEPAN